jgi:hypothetical protein
MAVGRLRLAFAWGFSSEQGTVDPAGAVAAATSQRSFEASTQPSGMTTRVRIVETSTPDANEIAIP